MFTICRSSILLPLRIKLRWVDSGPADKEFIDEIMHMHDGSLVCVKGSVLFTFRRVREEQKEKRKCSSVCQCGDNVVLFVLKEQFISVGRGVNVRTGISAARNLIPLGCRDSCCSYVSLRGGDTPASVTLADPPLRLSFAAAMPPHQ